MRRGPACVGQSGSMRSGWDARGHHGCADTSEVVLFPYYLVVYRAVVPLVTRVVRIRESESSWGGKLCMCTAQLPAWRITHVCVIQL
jgi:hypothetical protein